MAAVEALRRQDVEQTDAGFVYESVQGWAKLPPGYDFLERHVTAVGTDSRDNVYVLNRGERPVLVFDRNGNFLRDWGAGQFKRPHGLQVGPDDTLWITDDGNSVVRQYTTEGKMLLEIGVPGEPAPYMSCQPFNRCTHTALAPNGDVYVSDGYGNACVHKYAPDGRLLKSWGGPGTDPGQFNIPHNIICDDAGWVYVADRENHRVQVFDGNGRFETQWNNLHRPNSLFMTRGKCPLCFIAEGSATQSINAKVPNLGSRITITDASGRRLARFGGPLPGLGNLEFSGTHGICVDSRGDIYVAETQWASFIKKNPDTKHVPGDFRGVHKLRKKAGPTDASGSV